MDFIGFDDYSYSFPQFPEDSQLYKHFVIVKRDTGVFYLFCFNRKFEISSFVRYGTSYKNYICDDGGVNIYFFEPGDTSWTFLNSNGSFSIAKSQVVYSCDDLYEYKEKLILGNDMVLEILEETNTFVLTPIFESQQNVYMNVFDEVFSILPLLIVVLISFISIRKGISYLFSLLRDS